MINLSPNLRFSRLARAAARITGAPVSFLVAVGIVVVWAITGPLFDYSNAWQLVINTGTTIVTFLMVFLIQHSQNRDALAMEVKLDELVRAVKSAKNSVLYLDELEEAELEILIEHYRKIGRAAKARTNGSADSAALDRQSREI
jgi:low affinity Fe/Cu permease